MMSTAESSRAARPSWTVLPPSSEHATVLDHLAERFARIPRATWIERMARGLVHAEDGTPLAPDTPYRPHWRIAYYREVESEPSIPFAESIVYRDERLVVADKPPFLPVTPGGRYVAECLAARLQERLGEPDLVAVHRLDRHTSGLVLCVRRPADRGTYAGLFARGAVERGYEALGHLDRRPPQRSWRVVDRLDRGEPFFRQRRVAGRPNAETEVRLVDTDDDASIGRFALRPRTGKQHQLRLHLASLGFPILGDPFYPKLRPEGPDRLDDPLRLVARSLAFVDPLTGVRHCFTSHRSLDDPTSNP